MNEPKSPHPASDSRVYGFNKNGFLTPAITGRPPRLDTDFAVWMKRHRLTAEKLRRAIRSSMVSVARWRRNGNIMLPFAERLKALWPDCPVRLRRKLPRPAWKFRHMMRTPDLGD